MEPNALLARLTERLGILALEKGRFGRSGAPAIWVESKSVLKAAAKLAAGNDTDAERFDWLENLSAIQMDDAIVLSYFIRNRAHSLPVVIRASLVFEKSKTVEVPSVSPAWRTATLFEQEIESLFGIKFAGQVDESVKTGPLLGAGEFPLRKLP